MQLPRTLVMMMTPDHQGGIKREEEPSIATKQMSLHAVVCIQVKNGSQVRAPWEASHLRTETRARTVPSSSYYSFPIPLLVDPRTHNNIFALSDRKAKPQTVLKFMVEGEEKEGRNPGGWSAAKQHLPEDPE